MCVCARVCVCVHAYVPVQVEAEIPVELLAPNEETYQQMVAPQRRPFPLTVCSDRWIVRYMYIFAGVSASDEISLHTRSHSTDNPYHHFRQTDSQQRMRDIYTGTFHISTRR